MKKEKYGFHRDDGDDKMTGMVNGKSIATIKKEKRSKIATGIFAFILTLGIWFYASVMTSADIQCQSAPVTVKKISSVESKGYKVEYNTNLKINYTIRGTAFSISQLPSHGVDVYVDLSTVSLSDITDSKTVQLPLILDLPSDIICIEKSQEYVEIVITKNKTE